MIRSLRQQHRIIWGILGILLPVLLITAVVLRRDLPVVPIPDPSHDTLGYEQSFFQENAFQNLQMNLRLFVNQNDQQLLALEPNAAPAYPNALVYIGDVTWSDSAILLGALSGQEIRRFPLPKTDSTHLHIYSLAHGTLIDSAPLPKGVTQ